MNLKAYHKKRKFNETPEPKGKVLRIQKRRFVVQEHWAKAHHFDFRLEMEGVLKSWAVPKGVPEKIGIKRLAISVEDHPIEYANFEGKIPKGLYGAGRVKIFDKGNYNLIEKTKDYNLPTAFSRSLREQAPRILFTLKGKKLKGNYCLIKMKGRKNQWLLFKTK